MTMGLILSPCELLITRAIEATIWPPDGPPGPPIWAGMAADRGLKAPSIGRTVPAWMLVASWSTRVWRAAC